MKPVLLIASDFPPATGGVANYLLNLLQGLPSGMVKVLAPNTKRVQETVTHQVVERVRFWWWLWPRWLPLLWQAWRAVKTERPKALWAAEPLPVGTVVLIISKIFKLPYLVTTHGMDIAGPLAKGGRRRRMLERVLRGASVVTVNSEYTAGLAIQCGVDANHIVKISPCPHPPVPIDPVEQEVTLAQLEIVDQPIVLSVGRLVTRKGFDTLLHAWPQVQREVPNAVLVIAGDGPQALDLIHLSQELKIDRQVRWLGPVSQATLAALYDACTVFALPARNASGGDVEGFGMVFLEANSYGKPVLAGNTGGQPEAVLHQQTGLVVDSTEPLAVADGLVELLTNPALAARLGQNGKARVAADFQWAQRAAKLATVLAHLNR